MKEGALLNGVLTILAVLLILWLALKSARIILAVFVALMIGLAITAALGLMLVGAFNLISVAFAVLFVGLGVDFGIQFSVRYRAERHEISDLHKALHSAAAKAGIPLILAAAAVAAGFFSFLPTDYRGIVRTWHHRRRRHDRRICHQHHNAACAACSLAAAGRARSRSVMRGSRPSIALWNDIVSRLSRSPRLSRSAACRFSSS